MSVYSEFTNGSGEDVASNKGWADVCRYVEGLPNCQELKQLVIYGWSEDLNSLSADLVLAISEASGEVKSTLTGLRRQVSDNIDDAGVVVTDGAGVSEVGSASSIAKTLNACGQQADGKFAMGNTCAEEDGSSPSVSNSLAKTFPSVNEPRRRTELTEAEQDDWESWLEIPEFREPRESVRMYRSEWYRSLNGALQAGNKPNADGLEVYRGIKTLYDEEQFGVEGKITYRGLWMKPEYQAKFLAEMEAAVKARKKIRMRGMISTSLDPDIALRFSNAYAAGDKDKPTGEPAILLEIRTAKGLLIGGAEAEVLLMHKSKFKPARVAHDVPIDTGRGGTIRATVVSLEQEYE